MKILNLLARFTTALLIVSQEVFDCDIGPVYVGRKNGDPKPQIILGGIGIRPNHAYFQQKDDGFIYLKATEEEALENI